MQNKYRSYHYFMGLIAQGESIPKARKLAGISKDTAYAWANGTRAPRAAPDPGHESQITRAAALRRGGMSLLAAASMTGLAYADVLSACSGILPSVTLPDLPGLPLPRDVVFDTMACRCKADVISAIQKMRAENKTTAEISRATGAHAATVKKYAPPPPGKARQKCTPEKVATIRQMRADRYTMAEIAQVVGLATTTVAMYAPPTMSAEGDKRRKVTPEVQAEIARLTREEHLSYDKIALRLGLTLPTVLRYAQ